jgi:hypothetical protein
MDKVQKPSNSECYTPQPEPFRINFILRLHVVTEAEGSTLLMQGAARRTILSQLHIYLILHKFTCSQPSPKLLRRTRSSVRPLQKPNTHYRTSNAFEATLHYLDTRPEALPCYGMAQNESSLSLVRYCFLPPSMANAIFLKPIHLDKRVEFISDVEAPAKRFPLPPVMEWSPE